MKTNQGNIGQHLGKLSNKIRRRLAAFSIPGNYSGAQERTLHFLLANNDSDIFQKDIEEEFGLRPPTASGLLKSMERSELILRIPVAYDARLKKIIPTEKALQYNKVVHADLEKFEKELIRDIKEEDLEVFERVVIKMIDNLS